MWAMPLVMAIVAYCIDLAIKFQVVSDVHYPWAHLQANIHRSHDSLRLLLRTLDVETRAITDVKLFKQQQLHHVTMSSEKFKHAGTLRNGLRKYALIVSCHHIIVTGWMHSHARPQGK